ELNNQIAAIRKKKDQRSNTLLPDVIIFSRAVEDALKYQEFFKPNEVKVAKQHLERGMERAKQLLNGKAPWTTETGLVVRGYVSRLDGSVQPYGLIIPESYRPEIVQPWRLDIWFHGRGETLSENNFLQQRLNQKGYYAPKDTIVLHPYGRYSNAFKFAGEVDVLEALADVKKNYRIDEDRVSVRGFSMGGAACWQFAVHYPGQWFAANPGAGFSETPEFLRFFQKQELHPTWWEEKLWRLYDCPGYCRNLAHCPTIAYSGEVDIQKQAADVMTSALKNEGMQLTHIIGLKMGHRIDPGSVKLIEENMANLARVGRRRIPESIDFTTYTLKYNQIKWLKVTGLKEHWEKGQVTAKILPDDKLQIRTSGVTGIQIRFAAGESPFSGVDRVAVDIDGQTVETVRPWTDRSFEVNLVSRATGWTVGLFPENQLHKKHNLQGPIDDAFMDSFVFVRPTGDSSHPGAKDWADQELDRAIEHWRRHFRGHARVKNDTEITEEDIQNHNLILWGDPQCNQVMKKIASQLPIKWSRDSISARGQEYSAGDHALIAIYPNPLNPKRYVVLNSSFTFRDFAYLNNARQVPMLPDWAIVDLKTPPNSVWPGKIVDAGFFDESWQLKSEK
ncbi:MAG: hypothetical protein KDA84_26675, partial [Planctomycetaceae bacterium]|nr:hypothetical protein [Planctomycetaceae bacterium]